SGFVWKDVPRPLQRVESYAEVPWVEEDWSGLRAAEQEAALEDYIAEDRRRGFVREQPPLLRCALFRTAEDGYWFVLSMHHLVMDGWSYSRIMNEVFQRYRSWTEGGRGELGRVRPYRDYIAWLSKQDA